MTATRRATSFTPSSNVAQLKESATIAVSARARALRAAGRTIVDLGAGEPDFATPQFICEAAERAVAAGATRYTATEGILPLREAIAAQANARIPWIRSSDRAGVVVSNGSKQALFNACFVLFGDGDEVLIPTPGLDELLRDGVAGEGRARAGVRRPGPRTQGDGEPSLPPRQRRGPGA